jgi:hypothetical protein
MAPFAPLSKMNFTSVTDVIITNINVWKDCKSELNILYQGHKLSELTANLNSSLTMEGSSNCIIQHKNSEYFL